jgi:hypothetical protein
MTWVLILLCVNIANPSDVPGKASIEFESQSQCENSLTTLTYWLKFNSFKVVGKCEEKK